ncbi:hypothetical protein PFISCL1PPCAC_22186, partial [Pristionchus fissidentatus]
VVGGVMRPSLLSFSLLLLQLLQLSYVLQVADATKETLYKPPYDHAEADINPLYQFRSEIFFHDPNHVNGQIRDRGCQESCMRHCYCTYGHACRRSCIAHCDRGPYVGGSRDPYIHSRAKRETKKDEGPKLPSIDDLQNEELPYLEGFDYNEKGVLTRKPGRPVWNPVEALAKKTARAIDKK